MNTQDHTGQLRKMLHDVHQEPAQELWNRMNEDEAFSEICEELGYEPQYGLRLLLQVAKEELANGEDYERWFLLLGEYERNFWERLRRFLPIESRQTIEFEREIWRLNRIGFFYNLGLEPADFASDLWLSVDEVQRDLRAARIIHYRIVLGETLQTIGDKVGLTRERVRQILKIYNVDEFLSKRKAEFADTQDTFRDLIEMWVRDHPGCTPKEIAEAFDLREETLDGFVPRVVTHLILGPRFDEPAFDTQLRAKSKARILHTIRRAAEISELKPTNSSSDVPFLTGPRYSSLLREGLIDGPTLSRILQVFGTWRNACESAGVLCDEPVHEVYERRWGRLEKSQFVAEFLVSEGHKGISKYDEWARRDNARPSFGTIRNEFGGWKAAHEEALRLLRTRWVMNA